MVWFFIILKVKDNFSNCKNNKLSWSIKFAYHSSGALYSERELKQQTVPFQNLEVDEKIHFGSDQHFTTFSIVHADASQTAFERHPPHYPTIISSLTNKYFSALWYTSTQ